MVRLQREVLSFKQREKESLGAAWARLMDLYSSGPDLAIPKPILLQHFYLDLSEKSAQFLDIASGGAFLHLPISEGELSLKQSLKTFPTPMAIMTPLKKTTIQSPHKKMFR